MPFNFSSLKPQPKEPRPTDPIQLFQRLRISDPSINDLWLAQGDALRAWHQGRELSDVSISLNTGAGKTLVGLLIGQSLVNELRSLVIYACSSIQLVEQTAKKAEGYGLPVTTYFGGEFSNDLCFRGEAVCLTTYQALFNGRSTFFRREIGGMVFDDAHAAEHLLRDHFSLRIKKSLFEDVFSQFAAEFAGYFHSVGLASTFDEIVEGSGNGLLLIPPFEIKKVSAALTHYLTESEVTSNDSTKFSWNHLKDRIDLCAVVLSSAEITLTPAFVPVGTLPYFTKEVRRVYLSATLSVLDVFVRTFGRRPTIEIAPTTTAGECERMILIPSKMNGVTDDVAVAKRLIQPYKCLILIPSFARSEVWADLVKPPTAEVATQAIEDFKLSKGVDKLLLASRYDGMDLPGEMCRVIVIDDLPSGIGPLERYMWEFLRFSSTLRTAIASRVVQSFGRISRGMSDHGIVILTGKRLIEWLQVPKNLGALPRFLQKQLELGFQMSKEMNPADVPDSIQECLMRKRNWVEAYENFIRDAAHEEFVPEPATIVDLALSESKFAEEMWHRNYEKAAAHLRSTLQEAANFSVSTVCWHKLWLGYAFECAGDASTAQSLYQQAHSGQRNIPPFKRVSGSSVDLGLPTQAVSVERQFEISGEGKVSVPRSLEKDLLFLNGKGTPPQCEGAIRSLGQYLGFESSRPDKEHGTGPDVLWILPDKSALCMDAKTDKQDTSVYRKDEFGQLSDHVQWVIENFDVSEVIPCLIGPVLPISGSANPPEGVKLITLETLFTISEILKLALRDIASSALPLTIAHGVAEEYTKRGLLWPDLREQFHLIEMHDLGRK